MSTIRAALFLLACAGFAACGSTPQQQTSGSTAAAAQQPVSSAPADSRDPNAMPAGLPPLPVVGFPAALPMPVVRTVFAFAADHPEVLSKIPCFCGCQSRGHRHNDDCFVSARDAGGRVTAWEPHGLG
jgi:hypothetical protein